MKCALGVNKVQVDVDVTVVTGANQGLGFALAEGLAKGLKREDVV
jgi:short-subunit dehydrogenase